MSRSITRIIIEVRVLYPILASILGPFLCLASANASCLNVDLNKDPNSPLRQMPVFDQDGSNTCYAHAAATVIDYHRFKHQGANANTLTDPIYAAWATSYAANPKPKDTTASGEFTEVVRALEKVGNCPRTVVRKDLDVFLKGSEMTQAQFVRFLELLFEHYKKGAKNALGDAKKKILAADWMDDGTCNVNRAADLIREKGWLGSTSTVILDHIFDQTCNSTANQAKLPDVTVVAEPTDYSQRVQVDQLLKKGSPVYLGMCSKYLQDRTYRGLKGLKERIKGANTKADCGNHAVVTTAKGMVRNQCAYLVRNSWGKFWKGKDALACACLTNKGQYLPDCDASEYDVREYVGCWYPEGSLISNTYAAYALEKP